MVYILSGPVNSGKTTRLEAWAANRTGVCGVLAPRIDNRRHLKRVPGGEVRLLERCDGPEEDRVYIGPYCFSKSTFRWAQEQLLKCQTARFSWLIIDEIGPLELRGEGLEPAVSQILANHHKQSGNNLILIIREKLRQAVIDHFQIKSYTVFRFE